MMHHKVTSTIAALLLLTVSSCLNKNFYITPLQEDYSFQNKKIAVLPFKDFSITYTDGTLEPEFGEGDPQIVVAHGVGSIIAEQLLKRNFFTTVEYLDTIGTIETITQSHILQGKPLNIPIPRDPIYLEKILRKPDIILVLFSGVVIGKTVQVPHETILPQQFYTNRRSLAMSLNFAYLDAATNTVLAYGRCSDDELAQFHITIENWYNMSDDLVDQILMYGKLKPKR